MVDKENIQHATDSIKRKRSRHWDLEKTMELLNRWGEDNTQERLNSYRRLVQSF